MGPRITWQAIVYPACLALMTLTAVVDVVHGSKGFAIWNILILGISATFYSFASWVDR